MHSGKAFYVLEWEIFHLCVCDGHFSRSLPYSVILEDTGPKEDWLLAFKLSLNFWRHLGAITYLNYTQSLDLGINKLNHVYALVVVVADLIGSFMRVGLLW